MSINKFITIKDAIFDSFQDMGVDITTQTPIFMRWATRAEKQIGSYYGWKKLRAVITAKGCTAELPCGAMRVQVAVMGDHGCDCGELMGGISSWASSVVVTQNEIFLNIDKPDGNQFECAGIKYSIQDNKMVFQKNIDGQKLTIQYLGLAEDCDGFLLVSENHIEAINTYIQLRYAQRSRFSPVKMTEWDVKELKNEYDRQVAHARAEDSALTDTERKEIVAMLNDPYSGWGMDVHSHSYNYTF